MKRMVYLYLLVILTTSCNTFVETNNTKKLYNLSFSDTIIVNRTPLNVYDALISNINSYWKPLFSAKEIKSNIKLKSNGGYYELIDPQYNGEILASTTALNRGKLIRMEGPIGLSGYTINFTSTIHLSCIEPSYTKLIFEIHASGRPGRNCPDIIKTSWHHFIQNSFMPFLSGSLAKN